MRTGTSTVATNLIWSNSDFLAQVGYHTKDTDSTMQYWPNSARYDDEQINLDAVLNGAFNLLGRKHEVVIGTNLRRDRLQYVTGSSSVNPIVDILDFRYLDIPETADSRQPDAQSTCAQGQGDLCSHSPEPHSMICT